MQERRWSSLCALALSAAQWWPAFVPIDATGFGDWQMIHHNWEAAYVALRRFHEWPLWDPFHCGGVTILGNPESQLYTPLFALSFVLGSVLAVKVFLLLHIAAALLGGYWLARAEYALSPIAAWFAALGFGLSGCFAWDGAGGHATFLPFAFAPWLVLCFRRSESAPRYAVLTAALLALTLFEGGTYPFPYFALLLGFELIRKLLISPRRVALLKNATLIGLLVLLLGAIRLIPVAISLHDTPRTIESRDFLTLSDLLTMLTARKHEWRFPPHPYVWPEYGSYVGWPILVFALLGIARSLRRAPHQAVPRTSRDLLAGLIVFGLLMFGSVAAYFPWPLLHELPVFDSLRVPSRFAVLFTLYLALLAASGLDAVLQHWPNVRWLQAAAAILLCAHAIDVLRVNHSVVDRWDGPALADATPSAPFQLVRERDYRYASYPRRNVGTDGCYNGGMNWVVSRALWAGPQPQARIVRGDGRVTAWGMTSDRLWADVTLDSDARVVFNQNFAHGWTAHDHEVLSDHGRIAIDLPAGQHHVAVRYAPSWFAPSVLLSLLGVGLSLFWLGVLIPSAVFSAATMSIRHVIWDFNGTLLDDVDCCVDALNTLLLEREFDALSRADYLARFGFPVRDFYLDLGFDFEREDFGRVSATFIARYQDRLHAAKAHAGAHDALQAIERSAVPQSVVSAMELTLLQTLLRRFDLHAYMTEVRGLDHLNASSKIALGLALQRDLELQPSEILLVGDTLHDHELAQAIGCHCLLYVHGHQTRERLQASGVALIDSLADVARFVARFAQP